MNKLIAVMLSASMLISTESFAAFGGKSVARSGGAGVSRSMSRPSTPVPKTYSAPSSNTSSGGRYYSGRSTNQYDNYDRSRYNNSYNNRPNSAMRDIGVTAAGVAGGVLAASAIQSLIAGPHGTYTHPQYPGQYFNAQGQVVAPPNGADYPVQQNSTPQEQYIQQPATQQPVVVVQKQESGFLWKLIVGVIQLAILCFLLGGIAFACLWMYNQIKGKQEEEKGLGNSAVDLDVEFEDIDSQAMSIFYDFQRNSDNKVFVEKNTKYLPVDSCLSPASVVEKYEHKTLDCAIEQGKLRASVQYQATLSNVDGVEEVNQVWNFEKENGKWFLTGIEVV